MCGKAQVLQPKRNALDFVHLLSVNVTRPLILHFGDGLDGGGRGLVRPCLHTNSLFNRENTGNIFVSLSV